MPFTGSRVVIGVLGLALGVSAGSQAQTVDSFNPGANAQIYALAVQPDGKVLVGGIFTTLGGGGFGTTARNYIGRLHPDGSLDTSFNPGANGYVDAIAVQPDGRILVAGAFTMLGGGTGTIPRKGIGRLNADGSVDAVFDPGLNSTGQVFAMALQADGKIVVGGAYSALGGGGESTTPRSHIGRLNADGSLDASFDPGANSFVRAVIGQPDGKIVVAGNFTMLGGGGSGTTSRRYIGRLNADGSLDTAFDPGADADVGALALQADGRIVLGGYFSMLGGGGTGTTTRNRLGRLNADGSLDMSFDPGANNNVWTLSVQTNGKIVVGGSFTLMGGGGTGTTTRNSIGRLSGDGSLDASFNPGASGFVYALGLQADGAILVAGVYGTLGGGGTGTTTRRNVGRLVNPDATAQSLVTTGSSVVTWARSGAGPDVWRATFETSFNGATYAPLGNATPVPGGWQLTGLNLPAHPNLTIRARGYYQTGLGNGSGSIAETIAPASSTNLVENSDFANGTTAWSLFAVPDPTGMVSQVTGGVFEFYRVGTQAVVFQNTGMPMPAGAPVLAQFDLGNTDSARKRISVLVHDADFSDLHVCTFWLPPNTPLATYGMRTHTTEPWANLTISFYAATVGSGGFYRLDNASAQYAPAAAADRTECLDPTVPAPPGGANSPTLLVNGDFASGAVTPGWSTFGQIQSQVAANVFEFIRLAGTPAGLIIQPTSQPLPLNELLTATFQLGNSSAVRKRVTVILHDNDFSDLSACTFWLQPGQALSNYGYRTFTTKAWTDATVSIYPATVGAEQWIRLDNVVLGRTPATVTTGTQCFELGTSPDAGHQEP